MMERLDIKQNRTGQKYPFGIQIKRLCWAFGRILFRFAPRPMYGIRRMLLRLFGSKVGAHVNVSNTVTIYFPWNLDIGDWSSIGEHAYIYNLGKITIGEKATISQRAHLCAGSHDYSDPVLPLLTPPIVIGEQAWICADAFVGPGVTVGDGSVVGARTVVVKDVEPWTVVAGNPARCIRKRVLNGPPTIEGTSDAVE